MDIVLITSAQAEEWAGRKLTYSEMARLDSAIPHSSIPEAINAIVASFGEPESRCWRCDKIISYDSIGECWRDSDEGAECQPGSGYDHSPTNPED